MKKFFPLIIAVLAVLIIAAVIFIVISPISKDDLPQNDIRDEETNEQSAKDFTVYDENENAVSLSSMQGKPTVVNFWATWCGYCVIEMPDFEIAYNEYKDEVNFMMVDLTNETETKEKASEFIKEKGYTFPVYFDQELSAYKAYNLTSIPRTLIILADGTLMYEHVGAMDRITLASKIEAALEKSN
ncbi:MAG: TlpA family protein disulfide reductase [Clostridia bacterium]|nr:TlpA family protein disulfide reductase [Clostridia bacterium]